MLPEQILRVEELMIPAVLQVDMAMQIAPLPEEVVPIVRTLVQVQLQAERTLTHAHLIEIQRFVGQRLLVLVLLARIPTLTIVPEVAQRAALLTIQAAVLLPEVQAHLGLTLQVEVLHPAGLIRLAEVLRLADLIRQVEVVLLQEALLLWDAALLVVPAEALVQLDAAQAAVEETSRLLSGQNIQGEEWVGIYFHPFFLNFH